jgi:hypothetical protein
MHNLIFALYSSMHPILRLMKIKEQQDGPRGGFGQASPSRSLHRPATYVVFVMVSECTHYSKAAEQQSSNHNNEQ